MKALLIALPCLLLLSGCVQNGSFPPCDKNAPHHMKVMMGYNADSSDAGVVAQSATLQGWTNVVVSHPFMGRDYVEADCLKSEAPA